MNTNKILIISLLIFFQHVCLAESDANLAGEPIVQERSELDEEQNIIQQEIDRLEKKKIAKNKYCKKYRGKLIAYYGEVFEVKSCKLFTIRSTALAKRTSKGEKVVAVTGEVVNAIPRASAADIVKAKSRSCKNLEGKYITLDNDEIFLVQKCKKRLFPDWASFDDHRYRKDIRQVNIVEVSWDELQLIKDGTPFDSVLDQGSSKVDYAKVDTIPLDEACSGLEGRYVSYYSRVYKIFKCHKRPVDPVQFSRKVMKKPTELSSEQWLSLPLGLPLKL